jgi:riboflavin biosynthesis pyrimidine reductase
LVGVMTDWVGPGSPYTVLFDQQSPVGHGLPPAIQAIYGDWRLLEPSDRPYDYANFVISHDGRVSFNLPDALGGGAVSLDNRHDQWLMGLLRARADAVLVGDATLRLEPDHVWTAGGIFPEDASAFDRLRQAEGRTPLPLQVFASLHGDIPDEAAVFQQSGLRVVIASTTSGVAQARALLHRYAGVDYLDLGAEQTNLGLLTHTLYRDYGVRSLLCEGGPRLYGSMLAAGEVDEEFLTISPIAIGNPAGGTPRPGLVEGVAFDPATVPRSTLVSVRRAGDYLFLRSRYR